jgi:hypothetical protein
VTQNDHGQPLLCLHHGLRCPLFRNRGQHVGSIRVGGLPNPDLQCLALQLLDTHIEYDFSLTFAWGPRDQNVREDYLSHESEAPPSYHDYRRWAGCFVYLD